MLVNKIGVSASKDFSFGRRLTPEEQVDYRENALKPAFKYLGTEEVAMIMHGTCYPEAEKDIGVGSPYSKLASQIIKFEMLHGFNSNQLGPVGVISDAQHISPYKSTISTKNYLFLDLKELTTDKYANILSMQDINSVFNNAKSDDSNYSYSDFPDAFANYDYCMKIANRNFKYKLAKGDEVAVNLNKEFQQYKKMKGKVLYTEALFNVLAKTYGTTDFHQWNELDKNLVKLIDLKDDEALARYKKVVNRSREDFDIYMFSQFLLDKQVKENTEFRKSVGFKYISDFLVGFSLSDEWANQDLFLKNWRMGCPNGGEYGPQLWDVPVLDPNKLFKSDSELGPAGLYLKKKLDDALDNFDNVRIDHALGLIDPYIYDRNSVKFVNGKVDLSQFRANNISNMSDVDPNGNYRKILNRIIIPTLEAHGIDKNYPVWEDLCTDTPVFNQVYHAENKLPGITQLEYMRAENSQDPGDWGLVGSHDSDPANQMIKKDWIKGHYAWDIFYLAGFLNSNPKRSEYRDSFCRTIDNNDSERVKAKFAELFLTCKKIQISFADFFGLDKTYNKGGSTNNTNWKLRLNKDYEDSYYNNLASEHPTAINMPEILKLAVQAKSDMNIVKKDNNKNSKSEDLSLNTEPEAIEIIEKLDKYEKILKE